MDGRGRAGGWVYGHMGLYQAVLVQAGYAVPAHVLGFRLKHGRLHWAVLARAHHPHARPGVDRAKKTGLGPGWVNRLELHVQLYMDYSDSTVLRGLNP
jgi:hypothetical protein